MDVYPSLEHVTIELRVVPDRVGRGEAQERYNLSKEKLIVGLFRTTAVVPAGNETVDSGQGRGLYAAPECGRATSFI